MWPFLFENYKNQDLCKPCRHISFRKLGSELGYKHHSSYIDLDACAPSCRLCSFFVNCLKLDGGLRRNLPVFLSFHVEKYSGSQPAALTLMGAGDRAKIDVYAYSGTPLASYILGRPIRKLGGCQANLLLATKWLKECVTTHVDCYSSLGPREEKPFLPTRVVDVGPPDGSQQPFLFTTTSQRGNWIALSHRWGEMSILCTMSSNLASLEKGITMSLLPQTFQDAILLTRYFKIRYLWIDSLCIIQDSIADWQAESAVMPVVYANAYLTIAASASKDCTRGIFTERAQYLTGESFYALDNQELIHLRPGVPLPPSLGILGQRAWCLQERVLSHRFLEFGPEQMHYRCTRSTRLECFDGEYRNRKPGEPTDNTSRNDFFEVLALASKTGHEDENQDQDIPQAVVKVYQLWMEILTDYTSRKLTCPEDKLVAISGVARFISDHIQGDRYLAGIFLNTMPTSLLWRQEEYPRSHPSSKPQPQPSYRAPTWSWASVDGAVSFVACADSDTERDYRCRVLDADTTPLGPDALGQISAGYLVVEGMTSYAVIFKEHPTHLVDHPHGGLFNRPAVAKVCHDYRPDLDIDAWVNSPLLCLQVSHWEGLVLLRVTVDAEWRYTRLGVFTIKQNGDGVAWQERFTLGKVTII